MFKYLAPGGVGQPDRISFKPCMEFVNLHIQDMTTLYHMFWDGHHPYGFQIIYFMYSKEAQERVARWDLPPRVD